MDCRTKEMFGNGYVCDSNEILKYHQDTFKELSLTDQASKYTALDKFLDNTHNNSVEDVVHIGSADFKIPKNLITDRLIAGKNRVILRDFIYPQLSFTKYDSIYLNKGIISFSIVRGYVRNKKSDPKGYFQAPIDSAFWEYVNIDPYREKYQIEDLGYNKKAGYRRYEYNKQAHLYTNEQLYRPQDFIVCNENVPGKRCYTIFPYKDVYVEFSFHRDYVKDKDKIKEIIYKWLVEWEEAAQK